MFPFIESAHTLNLHKFSCMRQLLSAGRNSDHICQRQPIAAQQRTCCLNPIGGPDLGLSLSALRKEHRLQHTQLI